MFVGEKVTGSNNFCIFLVNHMDRGWRKELKNVLQKSDKNNK